MKRKTYLDALRIIAIFFVIFNHLNGYLLYQSRGGIKMWFYMFLTMVTRINVPLFFMISGALLLERNEDINAILHKRVARIFGALVIYSALCHLAKCRMFVWPQYLSGLILGNIDGSYWFLYAYLGMLFMLPYLRRVASGFNKQDFEYWVVLHFLLLSVVPIITYMSNGMIYLNGNFQIPLVTGKAFFYLCIGYYLDKVFDIRTINWTAMVKLLLVACGGIFFSSIFTYHEGISTGQFTQNFVQLFDYVTAIVVFLFVKFLFVNKHFLERNVKMKNAICYFGSLTFGVYLLDPILKCFIYLKMQSVLNTLLPEVMISVIWCLFSMVVGGAVTCGLKKLPVFRDIL